jgi:hypothetical protein
MVLLVGSSTRRSITSSGTNKRNETTTSTDIVMLFVRAAGVKSVVANKGNTLNAADPFYEITNQTGDCVARSVVFFNDLNPQWPPIKVSAAALGNNEPMILSFYDYQRDGEHALIGSIETSTDDMKQAARKVQAQRGVQLLDKKESFTLGDGSDGPRVFIYDFISTTGIPSSVTPSYKQKMRSGSYSSISLSSSGSTEPETDISSPGDDRSAAMTNPCDEGSVCISIDSNESTVVMANGTAPQPARKVKKKKKRMGRTLLVGRIMPKVLAGGIMPTLNEKEDVHVSLSDHPLAAPEIEATFESAPKIVDVAEAPRRFDEEEEENKPVVICPILTEAEHRGAEMAKQEDPDEAAPETDVVCGSMMSGSINDFDSVEDVSNAGDDVSHHTKYDVSTQDEESTVHAEEVFQLLEEIDDILTGFGQDHWERKRRLSGSARPPSKTRNRLAHMMGVGRGVANTTTAFTKRRMKDSLDSSIGQHTEEAASVSRSTTTSKSRTSGKQESNPATVLRWISSRASVHVKSSKPATSTSVSTRSTTASSSSSGASTSIQESPPKLKRRSENRLLEIDPKHNLPPRPKKKEEHLFPSNGP